VVPDIQRHVFLTAAKLEVNGDLHIHSALPSWMNRVVHSKPDMEVFEKR